MKEKAYKIMKTWCDTLLSHQLRSSSPYTDGGLVCPACHVLHGRVADLCFPLTLIWSKTGDERYLESADLLIKWSDFNLKTPDGIWYNDAGNRWVWTTTFSCIALGETFYHFSKILPEKYKRRWRSIYLRMVDRLSDLDEFHENIKDKNIAKPITNYFSSMATSLCLAWVNTKKQKYYDKSKYWLNLLLERFDKDGLLFGEGHLKDYGNGNQPIDMGYNLEETIPLFLRYASLTGEKVEEATTALRAHLKFVLPDGAIDNSFGSRHNKWTYWGSRTSDGIIEGLVYDMNNKTTVSVARKVLDLYEKCTHDGLLGMPYAKEAGEPTCLHHSFPHAKALAVFICDAPDLPYLNERKATSNDTEVDIYSNGDLVRIAHGGFRATLSTLKSHYIWGAENGGGSLNMLYADGYGPVCAATSAVYKPSEPLNQQHLRKQAETPCMTAQFIVDGEMACKDDAVKLTVDGTTVTATAQKWQAKYAFCNKKVTIDLSCEKGTYNLPIVCSKRNSVVVDDDGRGITIAGILRIRSDVLLTVDPNKRVFNQVGGLLYLPVSIEVNKKATLTVEKI